MTSKRLEKKFNEYTNTTPRLGRYQELVDKYFVSTSQILHHGSEVSILGTDIVLLSCYSVLFICICIFFTLFPKGTNRDQ